MPTATVPDDAATVPHDAQSSDGLEMKVGGVCPSSLQSLLRESAAPAFIGEDSNLDPNPTCTNIQARSHGSELEPRGDHVERGPR